MKKKESKEMKQELKNTKEVKKAGRGGARPNSGRKKQFDETQQVSIDVPVLLIEAMNKEGIKNKTTFINLLIAKDLVRTKDLNNRFWGKVHEVFESLSEKHNNS